MNYARLVRRNGKNSINSAKTAAKWRLFVLSINGDMLTDMDLRPEIADASASIEHNKRCSRKAQHINAKIDRERHCIVHQRIHRQGTCFIGADEEHIEALDTGGMGQLVHSCSHGNGAGKRGGGER